MKKNNNFLFTNEIRIYYPRNFFPAVNSNCTRFPTLHPNIYCPFPGLMVEILNVLTKEAGLKIIPIIGNQFTSQEMVGF